MKKTLLILLWVFGMSTLSLAQERANNLKINVLSPVVRTISVFYERAISPNKSLQAGFFYTNITWSSVKFSGWGITPEFRFYLNNRGENASKQAPEGFYLAPFVRIQRFTVTDEEINATTGVYAKGTLNTLGGGGLVGYQFLAQSGITVDLFAGPSYNVGSVQAQAGTFGKLPSIGFSGMGARFGVCVGYAF